MKHTRSIPTTVFVILLISGAGQALAQHGHYHNDLDDSIITTPLIVPTVEDFTPPVVDQVDAQGNVLEVVPVGVGGYFELSEHNKIFNITPRYRFNESWKVKLRLPWIAQRKVERMGEDVTTSGIGDISIDGVYTHVFDQPGRTLRLTGSVKLPTGDAENVEEFDINGISNTANMPLGTGSVDFTLRGQYSLSRPTSGLVGSFMVRKNTEGERQYTQDFNGNITTTTTKTTAGTQFSAALFGRKLVSPKIWLNLGASIMFTGDGDQDHLETYSDGTNPWSYEAKVPSKSTLIDLYPGISYDMGIVTPFVGVRIPISTSYDADNMDEDRDTVFLFQISYNPLKMAK